MVQGHRYLRLQQLKLDFSAQNIKMGVENVRDSNAILRKLRSRARKKNSVGATEFSIKFKQINKQQDRVLKSPSTGFLSAI